MTVLAQHTRLSDVYSHGGPFVTVYLDATRSTESGAHEVATRWRDVREQLDAPDASLDAIEAGIEADASSPGRHGLVLVAAGDVRCLSDRLGRPPATSTGVVAPLPHLLPYLAQRVPIAHVVVVADRTGADILAVHAEGAIRTASAAGAHDYPVHRTGRDDWSERHFQNRVENTWKSNARDVASAVSKVVAETAAELVVVAGDVRARHLIAADLGSALPPTVTVEVVDEGGRAEGASVQALEDAVHDRVLRQVWRARRALLDRLRQNLGRHEYAVAGVRDVVDALRRAAVDTLVLSDDPSSTLRAWVGPGMTDFGLDDAEASALGVESVQHDRFDAALVRAVVGTGAELLVTPGAHDYLPDGIGALLRYDDASMH